MRDRFDGVQGIEALAGAVRDFEGAVELVSHNRAFCNACCAALWVVEVGRVSEVRGDDREGFAAVFGGYAESVVWAGGEGGGGERSRVKGAAGKAGARQSGAARRGGGLGGSEAERTGLV